MEGAIEEEAGPHPTGLVPDLSDWLAMPDFCLQRSQPNLPIGTIPQLNTQQTLHGIQICPCPEVQMVPLLSFRCHGIGFS